MQMPIFRIKVCKTINDYKSQLLLFDVARKKVVALLPIKFMMFEVPAVTSWMSVAIYKVWRVASKISLVMYINYTLIWEHLPQVDINTYEFQESMASHSFRLHGIDKEKNDG